MEDIPRSIHPGDLQSLVVTGRDSARATGITANSAGDLIGNILLNWNGSAWRSVSIPLNGTNQNLWHLAAGPRGAIWAASPRCAECPVARHCAWLAGGRPPEGAELVRRRAQRYDGTDRQCRGRLPAVLRDGGGPATGADFDAVLGPTGPSSPGPWTG